MSYGDFQHPHTVYFMTTHNLRCGMSRGCQDIRTCLEADLFQMIKKKRGEKVQNDTKMLTSRNKMITEMLKDSQEKHR